MGNNTAYTKIRNRNLADLIFLHASCHSFWIISAQIFPRFLVFQTVRPSQRVHFTLITDMIDTGSMITWHTHTPPPRIFISNLLLHDTYLVAFLWRGPEHTSTLTVFVSLLRLFIKCFRGFMKTLLWSKKWFPVRPCKQVIKRQRSRRDYRGRVVVGYKLSEQ